MNQVRYWLRILFILVLTSTIGWILAATATAQVESSIYFISRDSGLYRFAPFDGSTELIHFTPDSIYQFSNDGNSVAIWNAEGLWVSTLAMWNPSLIHENVNHETVFELFWTPDNSRIIFRSNNEISAYSFRTQEIASWPWPECNQLTRHIETEQFALICASDTSENAAVALFWDGELTPYSAVDFEPLNTGTFSDQNLAWNPEGTVVAYADRGRAFTGDEIVYIFSNSASSPQSILKAEFGSVIVLELSTDGQWIALIEICAGAAPQCLHVVNLQEDTEIWSYRDRFAINLTLPSAIAWYADNSHIAILNHNIPDYSIWIIDLTDKSVQEFPLEQTFVVSIAIPV